MTEREVLNVKEYLRQADNIQEYVAGLSRTITDPVFAMAMDELQRTWRDSGENISLAELINTLSPEALRERGVEIPEGMRVSTRYFEDPNSTVQGHVLLGHTGGLEAGREEDLETQRGVTVCGSVGTPGVPVCVSVGSEVPAKPTPDAGTPPPDAGTPPPKKPDKELPTTLPTQ